METIERPARNAAPPAERNTTRASPSRSTGRASSGAVGTAAGMAANSSTTISTEAVAWAKTRRLSRETLERLGVASGTAFYPELGRKSEGLFFRYPDGWKSRSIPEKAFVAGKGFKLSFWNIDRVIAAAPARVYIVEGELDVLALVEAGVSPDAVLSVPNGAKERPADAPETQKGYEYVDEALSAGLNRAKEFVWCGDSDGPGLSLRADMVRLLGAARFHFINWPEGCKDANDMLITDGPAAVRSLVEEGSLPWPVAGLYLMSELPEPAPLTLWSPGFPEWESKVMLAPRTLSVVTGHPGHGKSALWAQIWFNVVREYGLKICVASFETRPKPHLRRWLRTFYCGGLEKNLAEAEIIAADAWIDEHYLFVAHPEQKPTLEWFLSMAEVAVIRHGVKIIQVDPWNRLEGARQRGESETEYIGRCLIAFHSFVNDLNCHGQILAHPAKMEGPRRGTAPGLEDISGSKNWENMVDQGFVVHRHEIFDGGNRKTEAVLYQRKARFEELGFPCKLNLNYSLNIGRYVSTDYGDAP